MHTYHTTCTFTQHTHTTRARAHTHTRTHTHTHTPTHTMRPSRQHGFTNIPWNHSKVDTNQNNSFDYYIPTMLAAVLSGVHMIKKV